jgi:hypothetical protein
MVILTHNRPEVLDTINTSLIERLDVLLWRSRPIPRCAEVLAGAGARAFCAGVDLKSRTGMTPPQLARRRRRLIGWSASCIASPGRRSPPLARRPAVPTHASDGRSARAAYNGSMELQDLVAVITGGARGIGRAIAARFVSAGAMVVIADLDHEAGAEESSDWRLNLHSVRTRMPLSFTSLQSLSADPILWVLVIVNIVVTVVYGTFAQRAQDQIVKSQGRHDRAEPRDG